MSQDPTERPSTPRVWLLAARPQTLTASLTPVVVGTAFAHADGKAHALSALAALFGAVFIQVGTNLFNDHEDFRRGADTAARKGPARATQRGWLSPRQVLRATALSFGAAMACGVYLVARSGWPLALVGLMSVLSGLAYTGGPLPLAYVGLGDLFVLAFFGLVAVTGTYFVQTLALTPEVALAGLGVGALATCILVVNNLRDRETDALAGKRTLVVRFGASVARLEYAALLLLALAVPVCFFAQDTARPEWLLPLLAVPLALSELRGIYRLDGSDLNPRLGGAARLGLLYGALLSVSAVL